MSTGIALTASWLSAGCDALRRDSITNKCIHLCLLQTSNIMAFGLSRKLLLLSLFVLAIIGATSVFESVRTTLRDSYARQRNSVLYSEREMVEDEDVPYRPEPTDRLELVSLGGWNTVMCWPSVGGIIVNTHVTSVELDFLKLPRFQSFPRSYNASAEDEFCRQLRRTGGKWWESHGDFIDAVSAKTRPTSAKERESLILGWSGDGGVWVIKEAHWYSFGVEPGFWRLRNAHTMDERCKAMEMSGAIYYRNAEDCTDVKSLLKGFGEHEREESFKCYFDPRDYRV
jgi:hypothetical protein